MANILVLGVKIPYTSGGQEILVRTLTNQLKAKGHLVDLVELPYSGNNREDIIYQSAIWRSLDLSNFGGNKVDLVIATKFPSYYVKHPKKSIWLVHQQRTIYDLYGSRFSDTSDAAGDESMRRLLVEGDQKVIGEAQYISGISNNVVKRLKYFNQIDSECLYPPLPMAGKYRTAPHEDFILSVGRLCTIKRVDLLIKSLPTVHKFIKLKIVGVADEPGIMEYFTNEIKKHHIQDRVEFLGRVSENDLLDLFSKALATYYAPHDEDYGFVSLESFASGRPVVSAVDSGGVLEFVRHEENGLVVEPTTQAMSDAFNRLV